MSNQILLKKIGCSNCGAELVFDPGTQMTNCNFCGSKFHIENATDEEIVVPDGILPFKIDKKNYEENVLEWLSEGDYTPDDILHSSIFDSVNGVYLPMWFFKGRYNGNWSASSGYDRTETYLAKDSNGKLVERTRTVTDWRPSNGNCSGEFDCLAFAGAGAGIKSDIAIYAHGTTFSRGELKPYDVKYTLGYNLIEYTTDEHDTWDTLGKIQADAFVESKTKARIPGDRYRDFYLDVLYDKEKPLRTYVPFWITYYKYADKDFYVYMDGTTTTRIQGVRPIDESRKQEVKKKFYKGHIAAALTILVFIISSNSDYSTSESLKTFAAWLLFLTGVMYAIGYYQKVKLINASKARRQEILNNHRNGITSSAKIEEVENSQELDNQIIKKSSGSVFKWAIILIVLIIISVLIWKVNTKNENTSFEDQITATDSTKVVDTPAIAPIEEPIELPEDKIDSSAAINNVNDFSIDNARTVYNEFSNATIEEDYDKISEVLGENLNVWQSKINISKNDVLDDLRSHYFNRWDVINIDVISLTQGDINNKFNYSIDYKIQSKKDPNKELEYIINGYFILDDNSKIVELKDLSTEKKL